MKFIEVTKKNGPVTKARNQSWTHIRDSMLSSFREFLTGLRVLQVVLKVDSEATVKIGTAKMFRVNRAKIGYFGAFNFHHDMLTIKKIQ
jgi:hypothetical protein